MKFKLALLLFITGLSFSCKKSTERTLLGKWNSTDKGYYIVNSIFVSDTTEIADYSTFTFREGGTGSFQHDTIKEDLEWAVEKEEATITIGEGSPKVFTILLDASEDQIWKHEKSDSTETDGLQSKEEWFSILKLKKIETDF